MPETWAKGDLDLHLDLDGTRVRASLETALLWAGGRVELPSHPQLPSWRSHPAPLPGLSRAGIG